MEKASSRERNCSQEGFTDIQSTKGVSRLKTDDRKKMGLGSMLSELFSGGEFCNHLLFFFFFLRTKYIFFFSPMPLQPTLPVVNQRNFADDKCWQGPGDEENSGRYKMEDAVPGDFQQAIRLCLKKK